MLNRRTLLAGAAAAASGSALALAAGTGISVASAPAAPIFGTLLPPAAASADPIHALLEAFGDCQRAWNSPKRRGTAALANRQDGVERAIVECRPTTLAGLAAQLRHCAEHEVEAWADPALAQRLAPVLRYAAGRLEQAAEPVGADCECDWQHDHNHLVEQCLRLKELNPAALLFFRADDDRYAFIGDDARPAARALRRPIVHDDASLGIGVPAVLVPVQAANVVCQELLGKRFAVAVAEIVEDPDAARRHGREPRRDLVRICQPDYHFS